MQKSMGFSLLLHSIMLLLMVFGLPFVHHKSIEIPQPIPVEIVPIGSKTMAPAPKLKPLPKPEEIKPEPPKPEPPTPAPEPAKETPQDSKPEIKPDLPPEPKAEKPKPEEKPKVKEDDKPKPSEKDKDKKKDKDKQKNALASVLKNIEKSKKNRKNDDKEIDKNPKDDTADDEQHVGEIGATLSMSEMDAIRQQISRCWNIPAGARDAENLVVEMRVKADPDGSVREVKIIDRTPPAGAEQFYQTATESARRAVIQCSPLKLPPEKYSIWKDFRLTFSPKDVL